MTLGTKRREISSSCELGNDAGDEAGQQGKMLATRLETRRETRRARLGTIRFVPWKEKKMSRANKDTSKGIDGRTCGCTWMDHLTRRVGGVDAAMSGRERDGALRASSFYILSRRSLSLYELYNRFRVLRVVALQVASAREKCVAPLL